MRRLPSPPLCLTAVLASLALAAPAGADTAPTPVSSAPQPVTAPAEPTTTVAGVIDTAAPALSPVSYRRNVLRLAVSEPGRLEIHYLRTDDHLAHVVEHETVSAQAGDNALALCRWMRPGRYRVTVHALDRAGNASRPLHLELRVRR